MFNNNNINSKNFKEYSSNDLKDFLKPAEVLNTFTEIFLNNRNLSEENAIDISKSLTNCENLSKLWIGDNKGIGDKGTVAIVEALSSKQFFKDHLTHLYLRGNNISDMGTKSIANLLPNLENLNYLNLSENEISDDGASALIEILPRLKNLTELYLCCEKITDVGASGIAKILLNCSRQLSILVLHDKIGEQGRKKIAEVPSVRDRKLIVKYFNSSLMN